MLYVFISESILFSNKLTDSEIMALIGHEIGHALSNHQVYFHLPENLRNKINELYPNNKFARYHEFSADRASLIASRDIDASVNMLKKVCSGEQWAYDHSNSVHPNGKSRVEALTAFSKSMLYAECVDQIDNTNICNSTDFPITNQQLSDTINNLI